MRWGNSLDSPPAIVQGLESGVVAAAAGWGHIGGILAGGACIVLGGAIVALAGN